MSIYCEGHFVEFDSAALLSNTTPPPSRCLASRPRKITIAIVGLLGNSLLMGRGLQSSSFTVFGIVALGCWYYWCIMRSTTGGVVQGVIGVKIAAVLSRGSVLAQYRREVSRTLGYYNCSLAAPCLRPCQTLYDSR